MDKGKGAIGSFLGSDCEFEGKLFFSGTTRIDGHFKGRIEASGNLIVGPKGVVDADIQAGSVICNGEIRGCVCVDEYIDIRVPGKVFGDIISPKVLIQEGVIIEGHCRTTREDTAMADKVVELKRS